MRTTILAIISLCLLGVFGLVSGCNSEQEIKADQPLLVINGLRVSKADFLKEFEKSLQDDQPLTSIEREELQRSFLVQLIDRELIHDEAKKAGVTVTEDDIEKALLHYRQDYPEASFEAMLKERKLTLQGWREELRESLIMEKLLEQEVYSRIDVTDMEITAYYQDNREQFDRPAQVRARQILVAEELQGQKALDLLRQGVPFAEVAKEFSRSPDAEQGGDLGFFARGEMPPEFDEVVFDLPVNRISDLVKSEYGYHIFLVEEKRKASRLNKKEAEAEIRKILEAEKKEDLYVNWLQEMRARAEVSVDWAQLEVNNTINK